MTALMASNDDTDESLMHLLQQGSHQAFSILVRRHTDRFYAFAFRLCTRDAEAQDMVQEAFLKIWQKPELWKDDRGAKFTTWFYRILINMNTDRMRRDGRLAGGAALPYIADAAATPEAQSAASEEQMLIEAALASLPERQKTALNLCFYEGLSNAEAAGIMGVKVKALESLLMRAKAGLKDYMDQRLKRRDMEERYASGR